ncbi:hypothetical protein SUDANB174_07748 (plasmid) [Streptomyces sp. enrichment culture]
MISPVHRRTIALLIAPLNHEYGLGYLIAAVILAGVFQVIRARSGG